MHKKVMMRIVGKKDELRPSLSHWASPEGKRLDPEHPWAAKGYWVSKQEHLIRREKGPEIRRLAVLKTYFVPISQFALSLV